MSISNSTKEFFQREDVVHALRSNDTPQLVDIIKTVYYSTGNFNPSEVYAILLTSGIDVLQDLDFVPTNFLNRQDIVSKINIPGNIKSIDDFAFGENIRDITFSPTNNLTHIGHFAFRRCDIQKIELPDSISHIGSRAFEECLSLQDVHMPSNLTSISVGLFFNCRNLKKIDVPASVSTIANAAFCSCFNLSDISMHEGLIRIGKAVFDECRSLKTIRIPSTVNHIDPAAFQNTQLKDIYYGGTQQQWKDFEANNGKQFRIRGRIVHCSDGDINY